MSNQGGKKMNTTTAQKISSYLSFSLGEEDFAVNVSCVLNILEMSRITKIPRAPEYMLGVINLRGEVLPLVDLHVKFNMQPAVIDSNTCILVMDLILDGDEIKVGAMVDSVKEVHEIQPEEILPAPSIGSRYHSDVIEGLFRNKDAFIMILDMNKVFTLDELYEMKGMSVEAEG